MKEHITEFDKALKAVEQARKAKDWPALHEAVKYLERTAFRLYLMSDDDGGGE